MFIFTEQETAAIRALVAGDKSGRALAIAAYRRALRAGLVATASPVMRFMSEIDTTCPDLVLRSKFRDDCKKLLADGVPVRIELK